MLTFYMRRRILYTESRCKNILDFRLANTCAGIMRKSFKNQPTIYIISVQTPSPLHRLYRLALWSVQTDEYWQALVAIEGKSENLCIRGQIINKVLIKKNINRTFRGRDRSRGSLQPRWTIIRPATNAR